ncbi:MAG: cysteine desulfurase family protein [Chloroflexota bacterium]
MEKPVYLDFNATTPVDPRVLEAMLPFLTSRYGNASSTHAYGYEAREAVDVARRSVAALIGASAKEIVFTGGGSETDNLAILGTVLPRLDRHPHVIASAIEHPAVLNTLAYLRHRFGVEYTLAPVDETGQVRVDAIGEVLRPETVLITVMHANNEVGTLQPVREISRFTRDAGVVLHVDAAQSAGKVPIDVDDLGIDLLAIAGHKLYAPKGIGALYMRQGITLDPLIHGSGQEGGMRAGTENVAGIVALGAACRLAREDLDAETKRLTALRDRLQAILLAEIPDLQINGHPENRLPNTLNVSFPGAAGLMVLSVATDVAASTGSACHSGQANPSPVLLSMGAAPERARGAVRLSLGRMSTPDDVERAGASLVDAYRQVAMAMA